MSEPEAVPAVDYPLVIHGEGVLEREGRQVPVVSLVAERLKYRPDLPWSITLRLGDTAPEEVSTILHGKDPFPRFRGHGSFRQALVIPAFQYRHQSGREVIGEAFEVSVGLSDASSVPSELVISGYLSENSVALSLRDSLLPRADGTVTGGKKRAPQAIRSRLGTIKLWRRPLPEAVEIGGVKSSAQRSSPIAQVIVPPSKRAPTLLGMVDQFNEEVGHLTEVLSLFSRQRVGCVRIAVWARWEENNGGLIEGSRWQHGPGPEDRRSVDPLINPVKIGSGGLDRVVSGYRQHPAREQLARAITYTVAAHSQRIIEHHALYAFTAIESLVDTLHPQPYSLVESEFSELQKRLKAAIKSAAGEQNLSKVQRRDLYAKLGELRRRPMIPRIVELADSKEVGWSDLWPDDSLEDALRAAYERRNKLIHQGHLSDPGGTVHDSLRITALAERLLLSELEVPESWVSHRAYDIFRWLAQG